MSHRTTKLVRIEEGNVDMVDRYTAGTKLTMGRFYALAAAEKVERGMREKVDEQELYDRIDAIGGGVCLLHADIQKVVELFKTVTL